jgi:iron complex outermembrane receptor protein
MQLIPGVFIGYLIIPSIFAQTAPDPAEQAGVRRDSIVVTGSYEPLPLEEADRSILLLPVRGQLSLLNTFTDILRLDPSLDLRQRGPNGIQADLSIRGSTFGQTLVLVNGRRMNDPQSGHHNLNIPIPLESLQSVEVMRGTGSTLYGADAVGGVVNFITAPPEGGEVRIRTAVGNFGVNQQRISMAGIRGRLSQQLALSRDFSTGFIPNRDYRNMMAASTTRLNSRLGVSALDLAASDKPFGAEQFYGNFNSWERTKTWFAGLRQALGEKTEAALSYRRHTDLFVLFRDRPQVFTNHHASETWHATLRRRETLGANTTLHYGAEGFGESIVSTNLGAHARARGATYASLDMRALRRFSFSAGARQETWRGFPGEIVPSVAAGYWLSSRAKLRASASRAFRLPTYTDLFYHDPGNRGSPDLRPERAWGYEAGADIYPTSSLRIQGAVFHRRETDVIDWVRASPRDIFRARNIHQLRFVGVETSVGYRWRSSMLDVGYTGLRGVSEALPPGHQSRYVFNYPVHHAVVGWTGVLPGAVAVRTRLGAMQRLGRPAFATWDLFFARQTGYLRPFVQFANLNGARYEEIPGIAMPGRSIVGGVEMVWPRMAAR